MARRRKPAARKAARRAARKAAPAAKRKAPAARKAPSARKAPAKSRRATAPKSSTSTRRTSSTGSRKATPYTGAAPKSSGTATKKSVRKAGRATGSGPRPSDVRPPRGRATGSGPRPSDIRQPRPNDVRPPGSGGSLRPFPGKKPGPERDTGYIDNRPGSPKPSPLKGVKGKSNEQLKRTVKRRTANGKSADKAKGELKSRRRFSGGRIRRFGTKIK